MVEVNRESIAFEVLHRLLVFLRRGLCLERAEISLFARLWIFLTGIHPILARFQFPDHEPIEYSQTEWAPRAHQKISGPLMSNLSASRALKKKREQRGENCEIGQQVSREAPVLAGVAETATSNVESANFCRDSREREDKDQHH
jgi:hypothetical protein